MVPIEVRSMNKNIILIVKIDLIFRKTVDVWKLIWHQGRLINESKTSWVVDGQKL